MELSESIPELPRLCSFCISSGTLLPPSDTDNELEVELSEFAVSYKPQKISPKFPGTVRSRADGCAWGCVALVACFPHSNLPPAPCALGCVVSMAGGSGAPLQPLGNPSPSLPAACKCWHAPPCLPPLPV